MTQIGRGISRGSDCRVFRSHSHFPERLGSPEPGSVAVSQRTRLPQHRKPAIERASVEASEMRCRE
jgi:hypothetical protein